MTDRTCRNDDDERSSASIDASAAFRLIADGYTGRDDIAESIRFNSPGLAVHRRIFAMIVSGDLVLKLPAVRCRELVAGGTARPFAMGKRTMREWIRLPADLDGLTVDDVRSLAAEALEFVR